MKRISAGIPVHEGTPLEFDGDDCLYERYPSRRPIRPEPA
jgi:hypothetical protein